MTERVNAPQPAFNVPPHAIDPSRALVAWFTEPPGLVVQFAFPGRLTLPITQWLVGPLVAALQKRFPDGQPLVFVLDLSQMEGRDPSVRPLIVETARSLTPRARRAVLVPPLQATKIYLAGFHASASLARVFGLDVSVESLPEALRTLRVALHER